MQDGHLFSSWELKLFELGTKVIMKYLLYQFILSCFLADGLKAQY